MVQEPNPSSLGNTPPRSVSHVEWLAVFPWLLLMQCPRAAANPRAWFLATGFVGLMIAGWQVLSLAHDPGEASPASATELWTILASPLEHAPAEADSDVSIWATTPLLTNTIEAGKWLGTSALQSSSLPSTWQLTAVGWTLGVFLLAGMPLTRVAGLLMADNRELYFGDLLRHVRRHFLSYMGGLLLPWIGIGLMVLVLFPAAAFARTGFGMITVGVFWPSLVLAGLFIFLIAAGAVVSFPLTIAAISVECSDGFDGLSRGFAYALQRPWHYAFYLVVATINGAMGLLLVWLLLEGTFWASIWGVSWGLGDARTASLLPGAAAGWSGYGVQFIHWWNGLLQWMLAGYVLSYFWTALTGVYLLLRRNLDATEVHRIFIPTAPEVKSAEEKTPDAPSAPSPEPESS